MYTSSTFISTPDTECVCFVLLPFVKKTTKRSITHINQMHLKSDSYFHKIGPTLKQYTLHCSAVWQFLALTLYQQDS